MIKKKFFFAGLLLLGGLLFAQEEKKIDCNWFTDSKIWSIGVNGIATNYYDFDQYQLGLSVTGTLDMKELYTKAGLFIEKEEIHGSSTVRYAPTLFGKLNPGIMLQDHFCCAYDYFCEYDLLVGAFVEYRPNDKFKLNCAALFQQDFSFIFYLPPEKGMVYNCCPAFNLDFYFYPLDWMFINLTISSYSYYRYFLFLSPDARLALDFKANENLTLEVAAELQSVDFFTASANYNTLAFSVGANWRF